MSLARHRDPLASGSRDAYIARRVRMIRAGAMSYEPSIFATIHPSSRECLLGFDRPSAKMSSGIVHLLDLMPLAAMMVPTLGDHHRLMSGMADGLEFNLLHRLLDKYRLGAIGELRMAGSVAMVFATPLERGFDLALLRPRGRRLPSVTEPRLISLCMATYAFELLHGLDLAVTARARSSCSR